MSPLCGTTDKFSDVSVSVRIQSEIYWLLMQSKHITRFWLIWNITEKTGSNCNTSPQNIGVCVPSGRSASFGKIWGKETLRVSFCKRGLVVFISEVCSDWQIFIEIFDSQFITVFICSVVKCVMLEYTYQSGYFFVLLLSFCWHTRSMLVSPIQNW